MVRLANQDNDACILNLESSMRNVAMFPVESSYKCFFQNAKISLAQLKNSNKMSDFTGQLIRKSLTIIKTQLEVLERGISIHIDQKDLVLFAFPFNYVTDMEERRHIFHLYPSSFYQCSHCYLFHPDKSNTQKLEMFQILDDILERKFKTVTRFEPFEGGTIPPEALQNKTPMQLLEIAHSLEKEAESFKGTSNRRTELLRLAESLRSKIGLPRTASMDLKIKKYFQDLDKDKSFGKDNSVTQLKDFGLFHETNCPLFSDLFDYDSVSFDLLHVLDGVTKRIYDILVFFCGRSLDTLTRELGNTTLGVPQSISFHKMEKTLGDFKFIALALILEDSRLKIKRNLVPKEFLARISLDYLKVIMILKDDAVGLLLKELEDSVQSLEKSILFLENEFGNDFDQLSGLVSCKLHEIFQHALIQTTNMGSPRCFSASVGEFKHPVNKKFLRAGSLRLRDQSKTVLEKSYFDYLFREADLFNNRLGIARDEPFTMSVKYRMFNILKKCKIGESVFVQVCTKLNLLHELTYIIEDEDIKFSTALECSLICIKRNVPIKTPLKIYAMPFSTLIPGRSLTLISYSSNTEASLCDYRPGSCLIHSSLQLLSSFARIQTSKFGIPLIFYEKNSLDSSGSVFVLELIASPHDLLDSLNSLPVIKRFERKKFFLKSVPFTFIRDCNRASICEDSIYVFTAGSRTYEHL